MSTPLHIFWFRRDLRLQDNHGLYRALQSGKPILPIFIFDKNILDKLEDRKDQRVCFIHDALNNLQAQLEKAGSGLWVQYGHPKKIWQKLISDFTIAAVHTNHDYEAYGIERDREIAALLHKNGIAFHTYKDTVLFEKSEVIKDNGTPYTVFTPYSRTWHRIAGDQAFPVYPSEKKRNAFLPFTPEPIPTLASMNFKPCERAYPSPLVRDELLEAYGKQRDIPGIAGTSKLGVHLRFGTISIRELANRARAHSSVYLNELIWRDFYHMIAWHFPSVREGRAFKPLYDQIEWRRDPEAFHAWCEGRTGYPIVDAGMRELNETGFMHNRVRMITASFLCKHLLLDWRLGEAYFAAKLLDFDFAANNGGWQWAAGSGCDAAPYFRIFNPYLQTKKFDPDFTYIRKWVPEFEDFSYPKPIVQHEFARNRCLAVYGKALKQTE